MQGKTFLLLCDSAWKKDYDNYIITDNNCVNAIQYCKKNSKRFNVIKEIFPQNMRDRNVYLQACKEKILPVLVRDLNIYHNINYSEEQWQPLIGIWFNTLLFQLYDKYYKILSFDHYNRQADVILSEQDHVDPPLDFSEFMDRSSKSDAYHLLMYTDLFSVMTLNNSSICTVERKDFQYSFNYSFHIHSKYNAKIYNFLLRMYKCITMKNDRVVFSHCYFPKRFTFAMMKKSKGYATDYITNWYLMDRRLVPNTIDWSWRKNSINGDGLEFFERIVCQLARKYMPVTYLEGFSFLKEKMNHQYKYAMRPNAVIHSCAQGQADEIFKVYLMEMKKRGIKICDIQHGGNYSIDAVHASSEYNDCNIFYTWGWTMNSNFKCVFKPMPMAKMFDITPSLLRAINDSNDNTGNAEHDILYINYIYPKYATAPSYRMEFHALNQDKEIDFLENLDSSVKKRIKFRIYPEDYGWHFRDRLEAVFPVLNYDTNSSIYESIKKARLVVITDWQTTFLESLAYNKPTLILRENENEIEDAAKPYIQRLIGTGIVVNSWDSLKKKLEEIFNDIEAWWSEQSRQDIVSAIRKRYAYLPPNSYEIWEKEILSYCR